MPVGVEKCVTTARELQENAECSVDLYLKSAIEGVVIKWVTQINGEQRKFHFHFRSAENNYHIFVDVFMETSGSAFNNGQNPVPSSGESNKNSIKFNFIIFHSLFFEGNFL